MSAPRFQDIGGPPGFSVTACMCAPWFERQDTGPYAVHSVGEAGVWRDEFWGFHYPYQAIAKAEELQAASTKRERFLAVNTEDPESSVERLDEAYWVESPRLCPENRDKICGECGPDECARESA